jgi:hypothetical protein
MIAMSMYCYVNMLPGEIWTVLCFLRILYNKQWTKKWCLEMALVMPGPTFPTSNKFWIESSDNDFILFRRHTQRVGYTHYNCDLVTRIRYAVDMSQLPASLGTLSSG